MGAPSTRGSKRARSVPEYTTSILAAGTPAATSPRLIDWHTATIAVTRRLV